MFTFCSGIAVRIGQIIFCNLISTKQIIPNYDVVVG